jgi:hypothetical protein
VSDCVCGKLVCATAFLGAAAELLCSMLNADCAWMQLCVFRQCETTEWM